jgi:hypothetical protein
MRRTERVSNCYSYRFRLVFGRSPVRNSVRTSAILTEVLCDLSQFYQPISGIVRGLGFNHDFPNPFKYRILKPALNSTLFNLNTDCLANQTTIKYTLKLTNFLNMNHTIIIIFAT